MLRLLRRPPLLDSGAVRRRADRGAREGYHAMRLSSLPQVETLSPFDFTCLFDLDPKVISELSTPRFLADRENVLLLGPPGVGKTHLAIALAAEAIKAGHRVYLATLKEMIERLSHNGASGWSMRAFSSLPSW
ncbi:MAG: ATP-binding protein [Actinomycetota bacterium]